MTGQELKQKLQTLPVPFAQIADACDMPAQQLNRIFLQKDIKTGVLEKICETQNLPMTFFYPIEGYRNYVRNDIKKVEAENLGTLAGDNNGTVGNTTGLSEATVLAILKQNSDLITLLTQK